MASPSPNRTKLASKRKTDTIGTPNRDIFTDLPGPSTYMRIPTQPNHISRNTDIDALNQATSTILQKGHTRHDERAHTTPNSKAFTRSASLFGREAGYVDSESDFDRAESDSGDSLSHPSPAMKEVIQLRLELATLKERQEQLLKAHAGRNKEMKELKRACEDVESRSSQLNGELETLRTIHSKLKDHFQCQICLEPLEKPWTLSPCGHVACLACLLSWFTTPRPDEDSDQPDNPLTRTKTCPQCRATVLSRPTPSFILKSIIEEMQSVQLLDRPQSSSAAAADPNDPWVNIFPEPCNCGTEWLDDPGEEPSELTGDVESDVLSIDSPSESSAIQANSQARREHLNHVMEWEVDMRNGNSGSWVAPRWEPPRFDFGLAQVTNEDAVRLGRPQHEIISLLRRGGTKEMIAFYHLTYDHDHGIVVNNGEVQIQLGWNISRNADDVDGRLYMETVMAEMSSSPERFGVAQVHPLSLPVIVRLVPSLGATEDDNVSEGSWATGDSLGDL